MTSKDIRIARAEYEFNNPDVPKYKPPVKTLLNATRPDEFRELLKRGDNPNMRSENGMTPIMCLGPTINSCLIGNFFFHSDHSKDMDKLSKETLETHKELVIEMLTMLIDHGAKVNLIDSFGCNCLSYSQAPWWTKLLLVNGANPNVKCKKGLTVMFTYPTREYLELLFEHGADPYEKDSKGRDIMNYVEDPDTKEWLIEKYGFEERKGELLHWWGN